MLPSLTTNVYLCFIFFIIVIDYVSSGPINSDYFKGPYQIKQRHYIGDVYFGNDNIQMSFDMKLNEYCPNYFIDNYNNSVTNIECSILWITDHIYTSTLWFPRIYIRVPYNVFVIYWFDQQTQNRDHESIAKLE